jgi:hypothetical protein
MRMESYNNCLRENGCEQSKQKTGTSRKICEGERVSVWDRYGRRMSCFGISLSDCMLQARLSSGTKLSTHGAKSNLRRRVREKKVVSKNHEVEQKGQNGSILQADAADLVLTKENTGNTFAKPQEEAATCITPRPPDHGERGRSCLCRPQSAPPSRSGRISKTFSGKISRDDVQHPKHQTNSTSERAAVTPEEVTVNVKRRRPLRAKTASAATFRSINGHSSATFRWKEKDMASPRPRIPLPGQSLLQTSWVEHDPPQSDVKTVAVPSEGETINFPQAIKTEDVAICRIQGALRGWITRSRLREEWNLGPQDRLKVSRY